MVRIVRKVITVENIIAVLTVITIFVNRTHNNDNNKNIDWLTQEPGAFLQCEGSSRAAKICNSCDAVPSSHREDISRRNPKHEISLRVNEGIRRSNLFSGYVGE